MKRGHENEARAPSGSNLRSQPFYLTTCLVVIIPLRDKTVMFSLVTYLCLLFLPLLSIIRRTAFKANILKTGLVKMGTLL